MSTVHTHAHHQFNILKKQYRPFSYDELKQAIIAAGGILRFAANVTLSDKLHHEEHAGRLHHDQETGLYCFCSPYPYRSIV